MAKKKKQGAGEEDDKAALFEKRHDLYGKKSPLVALGVMVLLLPIFPLDSLLNRVIVVLLGGLAGVAGYTVMVFVLDIKIAKSLPGLLRRRKKTNIA